MNCRIMCLIFFLILLKRNTTSMCYFVHWFICPIILTLIAKAPHPPDNCLSVRHLMIMTDLQRVMSEDFLKNYYSLPFPCYCECSILSISLLRRSPFFPSPSSPHPIIPPPLPFLLYAFYYLHAIFLATTKSKNVK